MKSSSRLLRSRVAFALLLSAASLHAQSFYSLSKTQYLVQTSAGAPTAEANWPAGMEIGATAAATLSLPGGGTLALSPVDSVALRKFYRTRAALDAAFPNGTYTLAGAGAPTGPLTLAEDSYPTATPQITNIANGAWTSGGVILVNPAQALTLTFSGFPDYASSQVGFQSLLISGLNRAGGSTTLYQSAISREFPPAGASLPVQAAPFATYTIPANRLVNGGLYEGTLTYSRFPTFDTAGGGYTSHSKTLRFTIAAVGAGAPQGAPVITAQPANLTIANGSSASLTVDATVNGSSTGFTDGSVYSQWYFEGRTIIGSSYVVGSTNNGPRLNITANTPAVAGEYALRIVTTGGVVDSAVARVEIAAAPQITTHPASQTVATGQPVTFSVVASGGASTYLWYFNNEPLFLARGASYTIPAVTAANAGSYSVIVTNALGTAISNPATLTVSTAPPPVAARLVNLSILTSLAGASDSFTLGYVVGGNGTSGAKPLVIRAAGPSLAALGVAGALADPKLELFAGQTASGTNDNWGGAAALLTAMNNVGAFPFASATSLDAAVAVNVAAGDNSVKVSPVGNLSGQVIAEIYDATPEASFAATTPRLVNVSVLKNIGTSLTAGFVIRGTGSRTVLIRAIGPTLGAAPFNVPGVVVDPQLVLFNGAGARIGENDNWSGAAALSAAFTSVGAFQLSGPASRDAALLATLTPGNYTVQVSGVGGTTGTALVEVYELP